MKKTNKKLVAAIVAGLTLAVAAPAMAASNPFVDVPAKHFAYDAVAKLAAAGIVDGYGDGTYRGDKLITRYEMAQMTAKAMAHEDKANAEQKALIEKLAAEFSGELESLGVRVSKLENKIGNIKWSGQVREWYERNEDAGYTDRNTRLLLFMEAPLTDEISFHGRMYAESGWGTSNGYLDPLSPILIRNSTGAVASIDQAYLAGKHNNMSWTFGRQGFMLGQGLIYAWFPNNDGASMTFGSDKTKMTLAAFRNQAIFTLLGPTALVTPTLNIVAGNLTHKASDNLDLSLAYARNRDGDFALGLQIIDTWALGAVYKGIPNITLTAEYGQNKSEGAKTYHAIFGEGYNSAKAWVAKAQYKGAQWDKPHTGGFWVGYRNAQPGFFGRNGDYIWETGSGSWNSYTGDGMNDVKGLNYGADYTVFKNAVLTLEYFDLETESANLGDPTNKRSFVAQLRYMF